ncbi:tetratricopeptide repeat protein [Desulfosarcina ovata]|uniref:Uncharacterized protein n=1 Tax=Desulfosarcina ovata subsp. ovata TaxID=2752305 RepID=A0A5K8ABS8_9BACT|nr:tetratricopeptide repeat protein [Desulfosarcina ovata]BBO90067.1 hypothetical protein DSCOOX_32470 [Desulfosarcina ovata subsp. ovata]
METAEKAGDKYYVFVARGSMGSVHVRRETYREAVDVLEKAVQAVPELDDPSKRNEINIAHAHGEKGDIDMAIAIGEKALERMQQLNDPHVEKVAKQLDRWRENRAHRRLG